MNRATFATFLLLGFTLTCHAQFKETYFSDTSCVLGGEGVVTLHHNNTIITATSRPDRTSSVVCIDTSGTNLWQVIYKVSDVTKTSMFIGVDGFLYCIWLKGDVITYAKVDPATGIVQWQKNFSVYIGSHQIADYDSSRFILGYWKSYNGSTFHTRFAFVSKVTGDTVSTHFIGNISSSAGYGVPPILVDPFQNIYFTHTDSIIKVAGANPNGFLWRIRYPSATVDAFTRLCYYAPTQSIYAVGYSSFYSTGSIRKIDIVNGSLLKTIYSSVVHSCRILKGDMYIRAGSSISMDVTKYSLLTDTTIWRSTYPLSLGTTYVSSFDVTLDDSDNVLITCNSGTGTDPGAWHLAKFNKLTGSVSFKGSLSEDTANTDHMSCGLSVRVLNNLLYLTGNLEKSGTNNCRVVLAKCNSTNGKLLSTREFGNYVLPSATLLLKRNGGSHTIALKQVGARVELDCYHESGTLRFRKSYYAKSKVLEGHTLALAPNGDIYFTITVKKDSINPPFKSQRTDSIYLYQLDSAGLVKYRFGFSVLINNASPLEIHTDDSTAILLYQKNDVIYVRKASFGVLSPEYNSLVSYTALPYGSAQCGYNKNTSDFYIFGRKGTLVRAVRLRKSTMVFTDMATLPSTMSNVTYVQALDTSRAVICGSANSISVYNTTNQTLAWTTASSGYVTKCVTDPTNTIIFTAGSTPGNSLVIGKYSASNGTLLKTYTYAPPFGAAYHPWDIVYVPLRNGLVITGVAEKADSMNVLIITMDSAFGNRTLTTKANFRGEDRGMCTQVANLRQCWIGGDFYSGSKSGFVFEVQDSVFCPTTRSSFTITACGEYIWQGKQLTISGTYYDTISNSMGCDSVICLNLTIRPKHQSFAFTNTCDSFSWYGVTYKSSGSYQKAFSNIFGCDSIITLVLTVNKNGSVHTLTVCDSLWWQNRFIKSSGIYRDTLTNSKGCDSVVTLSLTVKSGVHVSYNAITCKSFVFNGKTLTTSGIYADTLLRTNGCDSIVSLQLTVLQPSGSVWTMQACDTFVFNGKKYAAAGTYRDTLVNSNGCDSVVTIQLTVMNSSSSTWTFHGCDTFPFNGKKYVTTGTYRDTIVNAKGCDSIITLHLTMGSSNAASAIITACDVFLFNNRTLTASGIYTDIFPNASGCDSVVTLNLFITHKSTSVLSLSGCGSVVVNGKTYYATGTYLDSLVNAAGCDSIIYLHLTINQSQYLSFGDTSCRTYLFHGKTYIASGTYRDTLTSSTGCDSIVMLNLVIQSIDTSVTHLTDTLICQQQPGYYQWINCNSQTFIPGATNRYFVPATSGFYAVIIRAGTCSDTSSCIAFVRPKVTNPVPGISVDIYPNPLDFFATVNIQSDGRPISFRFRLSDVLGHIVAERNGDETRFLLFRNDLPAGLYFYEITAHGSLRATGKLVLTDR